MKRLWAPWRMSYVAGSRAPTGCVLCEAATASDDRGVLGHLMAVGSRHVGVLAEATAEEVAEVMELVTFATSLLGDEYRPDGFNIGLNQGRVAGAGITDHLHVHVVPRWNGDTNFMSVLGDVRVLPEALETTWERLRRRCGG